MNGDPAAQNRQLAEIPGNAQLTVAEASQYQAFEAGTVQELPHRQHVRLAWIYLRLFLPLEALQRFSSALQRFARLKGKPGLYHETVTWAYFFLINERLQQAPELSWEEFESRNSDLMRWKGGILEQLYGPERLFSNLARRVFVLPGCGIPPAGAESPRGAE